MIITLCYDLFFSKEKEKKAANLVMKCQTLQNFQGLLWTKLTSSKKKEGLNTFSVFFSCFLGRLHKLKIIYTPGIVQFRQLQSDIDNLAVAICRYCTDPISM